MADFDQPKIDQHYISLLITLRDNINACIALNSDTAENKPEGALNVNYVPVSQAKDRLEFSRWNGTAFEPLSNFRTNLDAATLAGSNPEVYKNATNISSGTLSPNRMISQLNPPELDNYDRAWSQYMATDPEATELLLPASFFNSANRGDFIRVSRNPDSSNNIHWPALAEYVGGGTSAIRIKVAFNLSFTHGRMHARRRFNNVAASNHSTIIASSSYSRLTDQTAGSQVMGVGEMTIPTTQSNGFELAWSSFGDFVSGTQSFGRLYLMGIYR